MRAQSHKFPQRIIRPAVREGESGSARGVKLPPSADPGRIPYGPRPALGLLHWRPPAGGVITVRFPALLRPPLREPRACRPRSWGAAGLGERLGRAGVGRGLGCEGLGYLSAAAARGRGAWKDPGATEPAEPGPGPGAAPPGAGRTAPGRPAAAPVGCAPASAALRAGQGSDRLSDVGQTLGPPAQPQERD